MSGILPSNGCSSCRERKIRCDLNRPLCGQCLIAGRKCKRYHRQSRSMLVSPRPTNQISQRTPPPENSLSIKTPTSGPVVIDHFLALFLQDYVPESKTQIVHHHQHGLSWAQYMPEICGKSKTLTKSLAAVSLAVVGKANKDEALIKRSFEAYGYALVELQKTLLGKQTQSNQNTLASMMALKTYELWQPTLASGYGWMAHVQGASRILQGGGFVASGSPLNTCLLSDFRTSSVFDAFGRRKACFLGQENWKHSRGDNPKLGELLLDIIVEIPALLERTDAVFEKPGLEPTYTLQRIDLMQSYASVHEQMKAWYEHAETKIDGLIYWEDDSGEIVGAEGVQFGTRLHFSSLSIAQMVLIYWSIRGILDAEIDHLVSSSSSSSPSFSSKTNLESITPITPISIIDPPDWPEINSYNKSAIAYADLIMRSEPFCTNPRHGMAGVQTVIFPLWSSQQAIYFKRSQEKFSYCYNRSREIGSGRGAFFLSLIANLSIENYVAMGKFGLTSRLANKGSVEELAFMDRKCVEEFQYRA